MEYLKIAEDFGNKIWPCKDKIKVEDIMLYGSVAYWKKDPRDLDLLVLHYNEKLDNFQDIAESKKIEDSKKLTKLAEFFNGEIDILKIMQETSIMQLISLNKFNTKFMNISFFNNPEYNNKWKEKNLENYGLTPKARFPGETFEECIFRQGLLYNQKTQTYNIPALQKYNPKN